ncbi:hypothetical protein BCR43DRAFT_445289 [Syncephalastrum racemosum]|uniref:Uncharacterized protein n=1 Tax=Syncephalastrum racemosum TaxID=13706 RepID=A0A1X2H2K4_SYNRA|nr:hypothetical protein BCR43DRAFT_445289 [Syncephalastrum racemosum]
MALPLASVDVLELSNVLGSTKELFFDLHVKGRNGNLWSLQVQEAALSVFASSQYVPTSTLSDNETLPFPSANPLEFLGTVYQLDEPLIFPPAHFFHPRTHEAISQVQIKNPGKTKNDMSGNERWSYLIRYPYELTVRGVLKYQVLPFPFHTQVHSARVCHVSRIDPATGEISNAIEQTTCDDGIDAIM